nr:hypothetical protein A4A49_20364 [Ipomoea batatas]
MDRGQENSSARRKEAEKGGAVSERRAAARRLVAEDVNKLADDFINSFRRQLRFEREESIKPSAFHDCFSATFGVSSFTSSNLSSSLGFAPSPIFTFPNSISLRTFPGFASLPVFVSLFLFRFFPSEFTEFPSLPLPFLSDLSPAPRSLPSSSSPKSIGLSLSESSVFLRVEDWAIFLSGSRRLRRALKPWLGIIT